MPANPTIVVPWDFSEHAKVALKYAFDHYNWYRIHVICVLERPNPYEMGWGGEEAEKASITKCVEEFFEQADPEHRTGIQFDAVFGDPATEVVQFAKQQNAELIVMSTHGRTAVQRLFMGSVAQQIVTKSTCPIILLPNSLVESAASTENTTRSK